MALNITSSRNRSKRKSNKPVTKGQNPQRANRQAVSNAKVTTGENRLPRSPFGPQRPSRQGPTDDSLRQIQRNKFLMGEENEKITRGKGTPSGTGNRFSIGSFVESAVRATLGRYAPALAAGYAVLEPKPTADGTLTAARERGDYKPSQNMRGADEGLTRAESFDKAFAAARSAGKSEFKWRGRSYNTKLKGE